uniref:Spermatogenesis-associated protein 6 N-terminal domain-containing protein n=1 Tax=Amphimedon queenslandica TaxID=400682 RepID=A0A1X7UL73_AMPQE
MEDMCVRCHVLLQINKVLWPQKDSPSLCLKGEPVFIQVCLLGQLLQTELFSPVFPLLINTTLAFDRVFTNCKVPSVLPEVLRGEHVKIELVQVNENYNGGTISGRYETSASSFLFSDKNGCDPFQIVMDKSHYYETSPLLQLSCCMSLLEARVISPLKVLTQPFTASATPSPAPPTPARPPTHPLATPPTQQILPIESSPQRKGHISFNIDAHETPPILKYKSNERKSHDQLSNHASKSRDHAHKSRDNKSQKKLLQPSLSIDEFERSMLVERLRSQDSPAAKNQSHETSHDSSFMFSDHSWEACPRRKLTPKEGDSTNQTEVHSKPFVVPHADPSLLSKREFCSCSPQKKTTPTKKRPKFSSTPIKDSMISKYLGTNQHGRHKNVTKRVQDKLDEMMKDLSGKEKEAHSIQDNDTIRTSFAAERDETLSPSQCPSTHNNSLLAKLGYRDYWSSKGSGKSHRLVFDETLEKIYNRLYQNS